MKKLLAILLALVMVIGMFAACGGKTETEDKKDDDKTPVESSEEESSAEESEPEASVDPNVRVYTVNVVDEEGNPMMGVMVQFCDENGCSPAFTDENGVVKYTALTEKTAKIADMPQGYEYATIQEEWDFTESNEVTIVLRASDLDGPDEVTEPTESIEEDIPEEVIE